MEEFEVDLNCLHRAREFASPPPEEQFQDIDKKVPVELPEPWPVERHIEFRYVTGKYSAYGPGIIRDVSLTLCPGERVAVVSRIGSGKPTLAPLPARAYEYRSEVGIDRRNIPLQGVI
ncbi:uncharacterized protein BCR38DRAFT_410284 [Pseudomassariella vexata]|uniref:ABC transporter domain-containing protein n=1 Tax=Pseudomassariella vexata TaxID=1141098 RepID=A0A1Y2DVN2_9PEZI|nr:uncharacterized protein BCR38DRAFT_410284 [Pseudomassariella vexata]ORY63350.1 hypothetical protein BCR38DRAFT_410284 [Pseudomassariella vexata]